MRCWTVALATGLVACSSPLDGPLDASHRDASGASIDSAPSEDGDWSDDADRRDGAASDGSIGEDASSSTPTCTHRFEAGEIVLIEPYLEGESVRIRLADERDWAADRYDLYSLEEACIVVSATKLRDGEELDAALTAPYWESTTGRAAGESMWVLDMNHLGRLPDNPPLAGLIVRRISAASFPEGMTLTLSLASGPGDFSAFYNPPDEVTEPEWVGASVRDLGPRHDPFHLPPGPAVDGHPMSWSFTRAGHYFVRAAVALETVEGALLEGSGLVHFVVEQPLTTPCGVCELPTRFCDEASETCVQCVAAEDCVTFPRERPPFSAYEACFEGTCVECDDDADCPNRWLPRCDLATHLCAPCLDSDVCASVYPETPVCRDGTCE